MVISIPVYGDFDDLDASNPIYDKVEGTSRGRHAICLIGYDDNKKGIQAYQFMGAIMEIGELKAVIIINMVTDIYHTIYLKDQM